MSQSSSSVYIIAEAGVNHNGELDLAMELVSMAALAGANAVKFQTFDALKLASASVDKALYQQSSTSLAESQREMLLKLELPLAWHAKLQAHAKQCGIEFLSTAFDLGSLEFLDTLDLPLYKIPSGELTNAPLLWRFAKTGKPLVLSTGMSTLSEVEEALAIIAHALNHQHEPSSITDVWTTWGDESARAKLKGHVTLLHCTSQYPTPWQAVNLRAMDTMAVAFGLDVGYSDHTPGTVISISAVARGARIIEKHFTIDRNLPGPDHKASLEVEELKQLVSDIRALELALGSGLKVPHACEWDTRRVARQSIITAHSIPAGKCIEADDLTTARAGGGMAPNRIWDLIGTTNDRAREAGEVFEC